MNYKKFEMMILIWGKYACFTRPELKVERMSYDIITPSAARGICEAIYWHPGMKYVIDEIDLMSPIKFTNIKRNEVNSKIALRQIKNGKNRFLYTSKDRTQKMSTILKDVKYCIHLHVEMIEKVHESDNPAKFAEMFKRRAGKGQCYTQPYLGCREFAANVKYIEGEEITPYPINKDLGLMLYDLDYTNLKEIKPTYYKAVLKNGIIDLRNCEVLR